MCLVNFNVNDRKKYNNASTTIKYCTITLLPLKCSAESCMRFVQCTERVY